VDEEAARRAFENALATYRQDFGTFFLARLLGLEMKTQYLAAVRAGRLTCTGRFLRQGKGISSLASELVDSEGELVAYATATWRSQRP